MKRVYLTSIGPSPLPKPPGPNASVQGRDAVNAFFDEMLKVAHQKFAVEKEAPSRR